MRCPWPALLLVASLDACATAAEPIDSKHKPARAHAALDAAPVAEPGAADAAASTPEESQGAGIRAASDVPTPGESWGGMGFHEVNETEWLAGVRAKLAEHLKIQPGDLIFSPSKMRAVFVRGPAETKTKRPGRRPPPRRFQIVAVDNQGAHPIVFRPITLPGSDEPPKDLRFLSEDRVVYEAAAPPAPPEAPPPPPPRRRATARKTGKGSGKGPSQTSRRTPSARSHATKTAAAPARKAARPAVAAHATPPSPPTARATDKPPVPTRLFIIQPLEPRARAIRCEGHHFAFTAAGDHLAYVGGPPEAAFVAVDGTPVYPRQGRTVVPSPASWSKDGHSLAFIESPTVGPARLVLLAEYDNATGDTTWDLPAAAAVDAARVFWAGPGRLVVGKSLTKPLFSASFQKSR